jgi:Type I restriction enzyme R protein N terminus (HSDR_N)
VIYVPLHREGETQEMFGNFVPVLLDDPQFKEDSVREVIIAPMLARLGYSPSGIARVIRSQTVIHPFIYAGTRKLPVTMVPDYTLLFQDRPILILDAKRPSENILSMASVQQAYSYAIHPEIKCHHFALCNGKDLVVFDVDHSKPLLFVPFVDFESRWLEIETYIAPDFLRKPALRKFAPDLGLAFLRVGLAPDATVTMLGTSSCWPSSYGEAGLLHYETVIQGHPRRKKGRPQAAPVIALHKRRSLNPIGAARDPFPHSLRVTTAMSLLETQRPQWYQAARERMGQVFARKRAYFRMRGGVGDVPCNASGSRSKWRCICFVLMSPMCILPRGRRMSTYNYLIPGCGNLVLHVTVVRPEFPGRRGCSLGLLPGGCSRSAISSTLSTAVSRRARSGRSSVTVKKKRSARDRTVDARRLHAALRLVQLVAAQILRRRRVGRAADERRQRPHVANVVAAGVLVEAAHRHIFDHACPQSADRPVGRTGSHRGILSRAKG